MKHALLVASFLVFSIVAGAADKGGVQAKRGGIIFSVEVVANAKLDTTAGLDNLVYVIYGSNPGSINYYVVSVRERDGKVHRTVRSATWFSAAEWLLEHGCPAEEVANRLDGVKPLFTPVFVAPEKMP